MLRTSPFPLGVESVYYTFKDLTVAYDFSMAADTSLKYAVMLARQFGSVIHIVSVQTPAEYADALEAGPRAMELSQLDVHCDLCRIQKRLQNEGVETKISRRIGSVADSISGLILEQKPDLLLLGAFGYSPSDRPRLGSTCEHILRTARCPVLTIGPHAVQEHEAPPIQRILCATNSLQLEDDIVAFAGHFALQMRAELEIVHVVHPEHKEILRHQHEQKYERLLQRFREHGISTAWTVVNGLPEAVIAARANKVHSSVILFGLHRSGPRMIDCPDGVVSATIQQAECPVLTIPLGLTLGAHSSGSRPVY